MYAQIRENLPSGFKLAAPTRERGRVRWPAGVTQTVLLLGLTSLFTDISSEMVSTVLPLYLVYYLRFTPFEFGVLDGLYQGVSALVRVASGLLADRSHRYKRVAVFGYGLSAVCKLGLLVAGASWAVIGSVIFLDRIGKGVRTAPRDALISLSSSPTHLGTAFGVHRALDTAGAMIGPILAFGLLTLIPDGFDVVFVVSCCVAVVGLGLLTLFVQDHVPAVPPAPAPPVTFQSVLGLLCGSRFRTLTVAGTVLGLATMSDGFLYLGLQRRSGFTEGLFPLLFVVTSLVYFVLAVPAGRLADRIGRERVFVGGYALLPLVYLTLLLPSVGYGEMLLCLVLFGAYYAATDGVLMALTSAVLPADRQSSGLALVTTATSLARLLASVLFGAIWSYYSLEVAVWVQVVGIVAALAFVTATLSRRMQDVTYADTPLS